MIQRANQAVIHSCGTFSAVNRTICTLHLRSAGEPRSSHSIELSLRCDGAPPWEAAEQIQFYPSWQVHRQLWPSPSRYYQLRWQRQQPLAELAPLQNPKNYHQTGFRGLDVSQPILAKGTSIGSLADMLASAALTVLTSSIVTVIGPTPPGTAVM